MQRCAIPLAAFSLALLLGPGAAGATELSGPLNGVLGSGGNPYEVVADIEVAAGDSLLVQASCHLLFAAGTAFDIHGCLAVEGGAGADTVRFEAQPPGGAGAWRGLRLHAGGEVLMAGFLLAEAETGFQVFAGRARLADGAVRVTSQYGLRLDDDDIEVRRVRVSDAQASGYPGIFAYQASPLVEDCLVTDCAGSGVGFWGPAAPRLADCEVTACNTGVTCVGASAVIERAWIHDNGTPGDFDSGAGLYAGYASGAPVVTDSRIEGNCFGVAVVLDGSVVLGDLVNDDPSDDGRNRFVANDRYDGANRHVWNETANTIPAHNCWWAGSDGVFVTDTALIDGWIWDDEELAGAGPVVFEPLAPVTAAEPAPAPALARWRVHPNPANPVFTLRGEAPRAGRLDVDLLDAAGRLAVSAWRGDVAAGPVALTLTAGDLPSGVYLARIRLDGAGLGGARVVLLR
ncbi:MAG: right-handed parallel beta-helix repeat-containing protein [Candidatus Krumholzibacteriota bacterium]|nr:right-handed parallel beta-helix repeat-containing protein [Candidatus Krumholzibacteriota bacterium]